MKEERGQYWKSSFSKAIPIKKKVKKARPNASCCTQSNPICVQTHWKQLCEEGLEGHGQWKADHGPRVYSCSLEHQQYPGLHEKRDGQQGVEGDCPSLLSPHLAPSGVLCPSLRPPGWEWCRAVEVDAEEESF